VAEPRREMATAARRLCGRKSAIDAVNTSDSEVEVRLAHIRPIRGLILSLFATVIVEAEEAVGSGRASRRSSKGSRWSFMHFPFSRLAGNLNQTNEGKQTRYSQHSIRGEDDE
jgi:hypothetical protein